MLPTAEESRYSRFATNFECYTILRLVGVVDGTGTSFDITANAVVVACGEARELVRCKEGNGVFRRAEAKTSRVAGYKTGADVVLRFCAEEEAVAAEDSISGESRALLKDYVTQGKRD